MADNKSSVEKKVVSTGKDERTGQWYVEYEDGTRVAAISPEEGYKYFHGNNEVRLSDSKETSDISIKVDVDVSDALKGLKAVQREARKANAALKELEEQQSKTKINEDNLYKSGSTNFNTESGELSIEGGTFKLGTTGVPWSWSGTDKKD